MYEVDCVVLSDEDYIVPGINVLALELVQQVICVPFVLIQLFICLFKEQLVPISAFAKLAVVQKSHHHTCIHLQVLTLLLINPKYPYVCQINGD